MTVKERTRPIQGTARPPFGLAQWLMVGVLLAAAALLVLWVVDLIGDDEVAPAVPATEVGEDLTLEDELAAIHDHTRTGQAQAEPAAMDWTQEDELAAIHGNGQQIQPDQPGGPIVRQSGPR
jgi:hypothetical protein